MKRSNVKRWFAGLVVLLGIGVIAGSGIVFAATSASGDTNSVLEAKVSDDDAELGIVIVSVEPDGPAAEAGVARGDILFELDGQAVNSTFQLHQLVADLEPGDEVELKVLHGDEERTLTATPDEQDGRPYLGLRPCGDIPMPKWMAELEALPHLRGLPFLSGTPGATIIRVLPESPADQADLRAGDRIIAIDDQELNSENDLVDIITAHEPEDTVKIEIERPGEEPFEVEIKLDEHPEKEGVAFLGVEWLPLPRFDRFEGEVLPFAEPFLKEHFSIPSYEELGGGVVIRRVVEDGPADQAGLEKGDRIIAVDGQQLSPDIDLADIITTYQPGDMVEIEIERSGEEILEMTVRLGEHPEKEGIAYLGVYYAPLLHFERFEGRVLPFDQLPFDMPPLGKRLPMLPGGELEQGVIIRSVAADSPAEGAGLKEGDVITAIDGEPVEGPRDLVDTVAGSSPDDSITLTVYDTDAEEEREVEVTLIENPDQEGQAYLGVVIGGFFRSRRFEGGEMPQWLQPFEGFFEEFHGEHFFDLDDGLRLEFDWQPRGLLKQLPFDFDFDFRLPEELFEELPCCPEESVL